MVTGINYPEYICITGLPFMLQGWNSSLHRSYEVIEDCPVYKMPSYYLHGIIPIIGISIQKHEGAWTLWRQCDSYPTEYVKLGENQYLPTGSWSAGMKVSEGQRWW
jgi:hypothetical protein